MSYETVVRYVQHSLIRAKEDVLKRAASNGIREEAHRLGEGYFRSLIAGMGYKIEFIEHEPAPMPGPIEPKEGAVILNRFTTILSPSTKFFDLSTIYWNICNLTPCPAPVNRCFSPVPGNFSPGDFPPNTLVSLHRPQAYPPEKQGITIISRGFQMQYGAFLREPRAFCGIFQKCYKNENIGILPGLTLSVTQLQLFFR